MNPESIVYNCDCVEYMRTLADNHFDLAIADPPYSHGNSEAFIKGGRFHKGRFNRYRQVDGNPIDIDEWDKTPSDDFFTELFRVSKNQIIWGGNYFNLPPTKCFLVWDKRQPFDFSSAMCEYAWCSFNSPAKLFRYKVTLEKNKIHVCQKPVSLYAWILQNYANNGDKIFDPMIGSGSSRIAAYKMGFDYVGCELDKDYFDAQNERFASLCLGETRTSDNKIIKQLSIF